MLQTPQRIKYSKTIYPNVTSHIYIKPWTVCEIWVSSGISKPIEPKEVKNYFKKIIILWVKLWYIFWPEYCPSAPRIFISISGLKYKYFSLRNHHSPKSIYNTKYRGNHSQKFKQQNYKSEMKYLSIYI